MDNVYNFIDGVISLRDYARLSFTAEEYRLLILRRREREYESLCRYYLERTKTERTADFPAHIIHARNRAVLIHYIF